MYLFFEIRQNILLQYHSNNIDVTNFNYMLDIIDIS